MTDEYMRSRGVFETHWGVKAIINDINHMYTWWIYCKTVVSSKRHSVVGLLRDRVPAWFPKASWLRNLTSLLMASMRFLLALLLVACVLAVCLDARRKPQKKPSRPAKKPSKPGKKPAKPGKNQISKHSKAAPMALRHLWFALGTCPNEQHVSAESLTIS